MRENISDVTAVIAYIFPFILASYDQLPIMQATFNSNRQDSDEKTKNITLDLTATIDEDQPKMYNSKSFSGMYRKLFI